MGYLDSKNTMVTHTISVELLSTQFKTLKVKCFGLNLLIKIDFAHFRIQASISVPKEHGVAAHYNMAYHLKMMVSMITKILTMEFQTLTILAKP